MDYRGAQSRGAASNQAAPPDNSTQQTPSPKGSKMTPEDLRTIATELKRFGTGLNLSREQKGQLKTFLTEKYQKLQEFRQQNPNASKDDLTRHLATIRSAGREKLEKFLTPDQLTKWDAEMAKAKDFLGHRAATA
jgi:periplasmic protein CpxP/Spy